MVRGRPEVAGALLVGGASRRFGAPKALAPWRGESLAERGYRTLVEAVGRAIVVGKAADRLELPFPVEDDASPLRAAIVGVAAALRLVDAGLVVVLPTDMPLVTPALLRSLAAAADAEGVEAAVPQTGPLPGAFRRSVLPTLERRIAAGDLALHRAVGDLSTKVVELDTRLLVNVNEPGDLARLG